MTQPEDVIVGKSVEEIEAETGNRTNSPVQGEDRQGDNGTVLTPVVGGQLGGERVGAGALGGLPGIIGTELGDDGSGVERSTEGRTAHTDRDLDSSEE